MATTSQELQGPEMVAFYQTFGNVKSVIYFLDQNPVKWPFQGIFKFSNSRAQPLTVLHTCKKQLKNAHHI